MIDLAPDLLAIVERILAEYVPECEVRAYGSRVTWTARDYSDLDLAVISDRPLDARIGNRLREAFEVSSLPIRVDVLDWHSIPNRFQDEIDRKYVVLQKGTRTPGWREVTLGECARLVRQTVSPSPTGDSPYIGLQHIGEGTLSLLDYGVESDVKSVKLRFSRGDLLFGKLRPYFRKVVLAPFGGVCSTDIWVVRATKGVDQQFLFYRMASPNFVDFATLGSEGTRMPRAQWEHVSEYKFDLPPLEEQHMIAHVLRTLDDKIGLNERMSETLEEMAQALFKSWFVDFDPVHAKSEARASGLPPELDALFPDSFEPSELGDIPSGWQVKTLEDVAVTVRGRSYRSAELHESNTALVTLKSFARGGGYRPEGLKSYIGSYKPVQVIRPGELVIACTDVTQAAEVVGRPAVVQPSTQYETLVASLDTLIVRPRDSSIVSVPFLYCLGKTASFRHHTYSLTTGTTVLHLAKEAVPTYTFPAPPRRTLDAFNTLAEPVFSRLLATSPDAHSNRDLRDTLLPKLLSGEMRLPASAAASTHP